MKSNIAPEATPSFAEAPKSATANGEHLEFHKAERDEKALVPKKEEPVIDIAQVLAANQVLLKNITRRMESLENHIKTLEGSLSDARQHMELTMNQRLLLAAPPRPVATWQPEAPPVDDTYLSRFSWWERIFKPERMRRPCLR